VPCPGGAFLGSLILLPRPLPPSRTRKRVRISELPPNFREVLPSPPTLTALSSLNASGGGRSPA